MQKDQRTYLNIQSGIINPFNIMDISNTILKAQEGKETIYDDHDAEFDYKIVDGKWVSRRKGTDGEWITFDNLSTDDKQKAEDKLNTSYPDSGFASPVDDTNDTNETDETDEIENIAKNSNLKVNKDNLKFVSPDSGNLLSGVGDTNILDLFKAIDTSVKSFKSENYYDPGTKEDYSKYSHTNTTDEDLYIDQNALSKNKRTGKVLIGKEEALENQMQSYLDERHKRNPDKYSKVKNFESDLFEKTGNLDYRKGLFNKKHEGFEGDYLENKYKDASHINWSINEEDNLDKGFDYMTANEDGLTFDQQSFEGHQEFGAGDDSWEFNRSAKHDEAFNFSDVEFDPRINTNKNLEDDDPYAYVKRPTFNQLSARPIEEIPNNLSEPKLELAGPIPMNAPYKRPVGPREDGTGTPTVPFDVDDRMRREGGSLFKAQDGLTEFSANAPIYDSQGKCWANCRQRNFDPVHNFSIGAGMTAGKSGDNYTGSFKGTGGYDFNPSGGTGGFKGYLGANYGARATSMDENNVSLNPFANAVASAGYTGEIGGNSYNWQTPLQYGVGAYAKKDIMGNAGNTYGGYANIGNFNITGGYNKNTGPQFTAGIGIPIREQGGGLKRMQFAGSNSNSGYNPLTNEIDPLSFENNLQENPISMEMFNNQDIPPEETEPYFSSADNMYAMNQSVNNSMDSWDAFSADMNKRIENPSLQMNQVDTNPLNTPDFSNPELDNQIQMNQDRTAFKEAREDDRVIGGNIIPTKKERRLARKEFSNDLDQTIEDGPFGEKSQVTRKNMKRFDRSNELGFDGDLAAMDEYDQSEEEEKIKRDLRKDKLNKDNKDDNPSFLDKAWNAKNRLLDSKAAQTYGKIGASAVRIAKPLNRILEAREEAKRKKNMLNNAYLSDNMFASSDADISGNKGDYDVNSGIFRPDDKVISRQSKYGSELSQHLTFAKQGGSFFNDGGEVEIDINMYKELISAGAELEIL